MSELKIEHGIPIPSVRGKPYSPLGKIIRTMKAGDSLTLSIGHLSSIHFRFNSFGFKCKTAKLSPTKFRVWRIK